MEKNKFACLSGGTLKLIAIITMLIDHIGAIILEKGYIVSYNAGAYNALPLEQIQLIAEIDHVLRFIGRIAFPIFCFLLVEGFLHTSDKKKYALRLFLFALLSEIPFDIAFNGSILEFGYQNVMFTLLFGFLAMWVMERFQNKPYIIAVTVIVSLGVGYLFQADYDYRGIILILILYLFRYQKILQTVFGCIALYWEPPAMLAFIPISLYNGKRGISLKYVFYFFYPVHLLVLCAIRYFII